MSGHCPTFCCGLAFFLAFSSAGATPRYTNTSLSSFHTKRSTIIQILFSHSQKKPSQYSRHIHTSITSTLPKHHLITTTTHTLSHPLSLSLSLTHTHTKPSFLLSFSSVPPHSLSPHTHPLHSLSLFTNTYIHIHTHTLQQHTFFA